MSPTILFVGGGSLGHVVPSMAVAEQIRCLHPSARMVFVCAKRADEMQMLERAGHTFSVLRAPPSSLSLASLFFPIAFVRACLCARKILQREKPTVIFSKGGYVSVPMCVVAWLQKIPIVHHESDSVLSLSSRLISRLATVVCAGFPQTIWPEGVKRKVVVTGHPVRAEIASGSVSAGQRITGFSGRRSVVLIIGGSQGSVALNQAVAKALPSLLDLADIIHLTGKGKMNAVHHARYFVRPSMSEELPHLYALADIVVSRAGAGVLSELAVLQKAVLTVPLAGVAHDHQVCNAKILETKGALELLPQERIHLLPEVLKNLLGHRKRLLALGKALHACFPVDAAKRIALLLLAEVQRARIESPPAPPPSS